MLSPWRGNAGRLMPSRRRPAIPLAPHRRCFAGTEPLQWAAIPGPRILPSVTIHCPAAVAELSSRQQATGRTAAHPVSRQWREPGNTTHVPVALSRARTHLPVSPPDPSLSEASCGWPRRLDPSSPTGRRSRDPARSPPSKTMALNVASPAISRTQAQCCKSQSTISHSSLTRARNNAPAGANSGAPHHRIFRLPTVDPPLHALPAESQRPLSRRT